MKKNFNLDVVLFVSALICILTGIILDFHIVERGTELRRTVRDFHIYSGYIMAVGLIFHLAWHMNWIKSAAKNIFRKK